MPTIQQKIDKWFIKTSQDGQPIPQTRHEWARVGDNATASNLRRYAHATVTPIYESDNYMERWHNEIDAMTNSSDPSQCRIYHSTWRINDVETLGVGNGGETQPLLQNADNAGVDVFMMASGHAWLKFKNDNYVNDLGINTCAVDYRYASFGSIHQKFTIFKRPSGDSAIVGSIDIDTHRWGRRPHSDTDPERPHGPTHEVGVEVTGDALSDLEWEFVQRYRDESRDNWTGDLEGPGFVGTPPDISQNEEPPTRNNQQGEQRVQVLLTYGRGNEYSWSEPSEFTVWASYMNAIKQTSTYLYIEGQYFTHFGKFDDPWYDDSAFHHASPFYQLAEAIRRGVNVMVVVAHDPEWKVIKRKREQGIRYLHDVAASASGDFHIAYLSNGSSTIYVHSKLMLCDDEFTLLGSANFNQRSLTTDGELQLGILDENEQFTETLRTDLWNEHLDGSASLSGSLQDHIDTFTNAIENNDGRLRSYPETEEPSSGGWFSNRIDPYHGPPKRTVRRDN